MFTVVHSLPFLQAQPASPTDIQPAWLSSAQFGVNSAISVATLIASIVQAAKRPQYTGQAQPSMPMIDPNTVQPQQRSVSQNGKTRYQNDGEEEDEYYKPRYTRRYRSRARNWDGEEEDSGIWPRSRNGEQSYDEERLPILPKKHTGTQNSNPKKLDSKRQTQKVVEDEEKDTLAVKSTSEVSDTDQEEGKDNFDIQ